MDNRRRNRSLEGLQANVARLKAYRSNLVIFPRDAKKPKKFEASKEDATAAAQQVKGTVMPITKEAAAVETVKITQEMKVRGGVGTRARDRHGLPGGMGAR